MLKPGVMFVDTLSGGVLMDVGADRFLALNSFSAKVWGHLAVGHTVPEIIGKIALDRGIAYKSAEALLYSQLQSWEQADLINTPQPPIELPLPRPSAPSPSRNEFSPDAISSARLVPRLFMSLYIAEWKYRRAVARLGLARALKALQAEKGPLTRLQRGVVRTTLRSYHALRRAFRQGEDSRDCLFRSLALAAVLRRQGVDAELCIAVVDMPFSSHAWVEADGYLLNDTVRKCEDYRIIGRF